MVATSCSTIVDKQRQCRLKLLALGEENYRLLLPLSMRTYYCVRKKMVAKVRNESIVDTNLTTIFSTFTCHSHKIGPI